MKSLKEIFKNVDYEIQTGIITEVEKKFECPNCNKKVLLPGHITDYNCQSCKIVTDVNNSAITSQTWNNIRYNTKIRRKRDWNHPAIPDLPTRKRTTLNRT